MSQPDPGLPPTDAISEQDLHDQSKRKERVRTETENKGKTVDAIVERMTKAEANRSNMKEKTVMFGEQCRGVIDEMCSAKDEWTRSWDAFPTDD